MKNTPFKHGALTENSFGLGAFTRRTVRIRAAELALVDGFLSSAATESHFAQAKRELTSEPGLDAKNEILEFAPMSQCRDPLPSSTGHKVRVAPSEAERLVDGGIAEAKIEQSRQASQVAAKPNL